MLPSDQDIHAAARRVVAYYRNIGVDLDVPVQAKDGSTFTVRELIYEPRDYQITRQPGVVVITVTNTAKRAAGLYDMAHGLAEGLHVTYQGRSLILREF